MNPTTRPEALSAGQAAFAAAVLARTQAREIFARFDSGGLRVVPMKGVWFSNWLYDDPSLRPMTDVDLLVAPGDAAFAGRILRELGYQPDSSPRARIGFGAILERTYRRPNSLPVELHRSVATGRGAARLSERWLAEGAPGVAPFDFACVRLPDVELCLVGLALHFRDHGLCMADYQAEDVRRLARLPGLCPRRLTRAAREAACELALDRMLWAAELDPERLGLRLAPRLYARRGLLRLLTRREGSALRPRLGLDSRRPTERLWRLGLHVCLSRDSLIESAASQADHLRFTLKTLWRMARGEAGDE